MDKNATRGKGDTPGISLSGRMRAVTALVPVCDCVWDVGCDHGYVPIFLVSNGRCKRAVASDVRPGPLARAKDNVRNCCLEDKISTVISDGLKAASEGIVDQVPDTVIMAGMGGDLMIRLMRESETVVLDARFLVLQPQTDVGEVRAYVREAGFVIADEDLVFEDGKYYPMFLAKNSRYFIEGHDGPLELTDIPNTSAASDPSDIPNPSAASGPPGLSPEALDRYGPLLISRRHPVLPKLIEWEDRIDGDIFIKITEAMKNGDAGGRMADRVKQLERDRGLRRAVVDYLNGE